MVLADNELTRLAGVIRSNPVSLSGVRGRRCAFRVTDKSWRPGLEMSIGVPLASHNSHAGFTKPAV